MNKRFSTLMAIALMAGGLSASAAVDPGTVTPTKIAPADKYYHIMNSTNYLAADKRDGADSIKVMSSASGTANFTEVTSLDSCMWKLTITVQPTTGDSVFTFENKATQAKLNLPAKDANAIVTEKDPITEWSWKTTANGPIAAKVGNDVYSMILDGSVVKVKKNATSATDWTIAEVANVTLDATYLNAQNSKFFKLAFGNDIAGNPFTKYSLKAIEVKEGSALSDSVFVQVIGEKKVNENFYGTKFETDTLFIIADTVRYENKTAGSWNAGEGYKFIVDTLAHKAFGTPVYGGTTAGDTVPMAGRHLGTYKYKFELNTGRIAGDSLIVGVGAQGDHDKTQVASPDVATVGAKLAWGYIGAAGTKVLTTSVNTDALPYITLGAGTKAVIDASKSYYVQVVKGETAANNGKYWVSGLGSAATAPEYAAAKSDNMPSTQWSVKKDGAGRYQFVNRDNKSATTVNGYVYSLDGNYVVTTAPGKNDTVKITAIDDAVKADKYLGYKHFTADELAALSVKLQFVTPLGTDAYVYVASNDSLVKAKAMDEADAMKFKLVAANGASDKKFGSDDLVRSAYLLQEQFGDKRVLGFNYNKAGDKVFRMMKTNQTVGFDSTAVYFRAASNAGEYQLVIAKKSGTQFSAPVEFAELSSTVDSVVTIAGSNANLAPTSLNSNVTGYFKIVTPAAPNYVDITNSSSKHIRFSSVENSTLMLGMNEEFKPVLKAEAEMDAAYSLFVDTASVADKKNPKFYLMTTAGLGELKAETVDAIQANYLNVDKDGNLEFIVAKQFGETKDTLLVYNRKDLTAAPDTVKKADNKAMFMFRATPVEGEYLIEAATGKCMQQINGKLALVDADNALAFTSETVDAPVGNESIDAATIKVVAGEGNVTVYGAAGKKVSVSDVLGRTTTVVATSDSQTVAVAAGVAIVAVEGEAAVKAVVK